ncbi:acyl-CoA synthetase (AMP-forming)/AMP-acid ligase II [Streptomyces sp. AK010]|nr:acyl-CoA synthetase (AMP-forming)/AMP-acid ligase II [Streptomyces sp. AK010]
MGAHLDTRGLERRKHPERLLILAELPLTPAGKPDRAALRERCTTDAEEKRPLASAG